MIGTLERYSFDSLLVRTDFTSEDGWDRIEADARRPNDDGFAAYVVPVSDPAFDGASWDELRAAVPSNDSGASVMFVVDSVTITSPDHPILVVDLVQYQGEQLTPFRCVPAALWSVDNNLNTQNMGWDEFAGGLDEQGIYRGC